MAKKPVIMIFLCWLFFNAGAYAVAQQDDPVDINSNLMEIFDTKKLITFSGDVVVKKGRVRLYCDKLDVYYTENEETKKKDVDYMVATGNVKVINEDKVATGNMGKYYKREDMIVLEGNPVYMQEKGTNQLTANKVTFYIKENKSVIEGNRPKIIFQTGN